MIEREYMGRKLSIKVWYQEPSMKCTVTYGLSSIDLPRHIDELRGWLRGIMDEDGAQKRYKTIKKEVNDMLKEYQLEYSDGTLLVEQFNFPDIPIINTYGVQNGQVHIMSGATPMELWAAPSRGGEVWADRYVPYIEYLSDEEYQEKRDKGELETGTIYCVLN